MKSASSAGWLSEDQLLLLLLLPVLKHKDNRTWGKAAPRRFSRTSTWRWTVESVATLCCLWAGRPPFSFRGLIRSRHIISCFCQDSLDFLDFTYFLMSTKNILLLWTSSIFTWLSPQKADSWLFFSRVGETLRMTESFPKNYGLCIPKMPRIFLKYMIMSFSEDKCALV